MVYLSACVVGTTVYPEVQGYPRQAGCPKGVSNRMTSRGAINEQSDNGVLNHVTSHNNSPRTRGPLSAIHTHDLVSVERIETNEQVVIRLHNTGFFFIKLEYYDVWGMSDVFPSRVI